MTTAAALLLLQLLVLLLLLQLFLLLLLLQPLLLLLLLLQLLLLLLLLLPPSRLSSLSLSISLPTSQGVASRTGGTRTPRSSTPGLAVAPPKNLRQHTAPPPSG